MAGHKVVVIGGSAGALEPLRTLIGGLPPHFPAAVFIALHTSPDSPGILPDILKRSTSLEVAYARHGEAITPGRIYVAPSNRHLLIKRGSLRLTHGPKENGFRPAVDPLFRTAAAAYGQRVIGVVLSGGLDDGTYGLLLIKEAGGVSVVQDPQEASVPSMPQSARESVEIDHVVAAAAMGPLLVRLTRQSVDDEGKTMVRDKQSRRDTAEVGANSLESNTMPGAPSGFVCPDCGGALWEIQSEKMLRYQCHVGHRYSADGLATRHEEALELAMWTALRALEENAALHRRLAARTAARGLSAISDNYEARARDVEDRADVVRSVLVKQEPAGPVNDVARERRGNGKRGNGKKSRGKIN